MTLEELLAIWMQPSVIRIVMFGFASVLLWRVPIIGLLFYPFRLFNTFVHELSHGAAAVLTGGSFRRFVVHPNREGLATTRGGSRWVTVSAGYLGSSIFGGLLLLLTATTVSSQTVLLWLGILLGLFCLAFVRNLFGFVAGLVLASLLFLAGYQLEPEQSALLLFLLAVQTMLSALNSIIDLVRLSSRRWDQNPMTDAHAMAQITGIPALFWALLWSAIALVICAGAITLAYRGGPLL